MFLKRRNAILIVAAMLLAQALAVAADTPSVASAKEVKWGAPPPVFPPGARFSVMAGDPAATGLVTVRFEMPAGYTIPPHFHPTDEHVTVLAGSFSIGMGDLIDKTHALTLAAGRIMALPWRTCITMRVYTTTGATIQVQHARPFRDYSTSIRPMIQVKKRPQ